jgi:putative hemolysin
MSARQGRLIDLGRTIRGPVKRRLFQTMVEPPLARFLSVSTFNRLYEASPSRPDEETYWSTILRVLDVRLEVSDEDCEKLPASGPLVAVANHPFGGLDGVILGELLTRRRRDVRLLGNHLLAQIPELASSIIAVDPWGGEGAARANIAPLKQALRFVSGGGALGLFPAGTVSHLSLGSGVSDPPWRRTVATLVRRTGATVVPVFFEGRNSVVFQLAGLVHPALRTALLPKELLRRAGSTVRVRIGRPIGPEKVARYEDDRTLTEYLRWKTYMLAHRESPIRPRFAPRAAATTAPSPAPAPLAPPVPGGLLAAEVARLPANAQLVSAGELAVYVARAPQIPAVMREIGQLREKTFREVEEGTGTPCDLDAYDERYLHLFMWHAGRSEIVGSYRIGLVDEILAEQGPRGLYTSSLFKFNAGFLERLGPALELGRSFIRAEYQRKPTSLALLWRGIGELLVRNPRYKVLFGPVSISRAYHSVSKRLMIEYLEKNHGDDALGALVKPKNRPKGKLEPRARAALEVLAKDVDDVSSLVSEIEEDSKGMPVLLRHYLKLNARLLGFNVDPAFGHCVDGLILVDLRTTEPRILKRFMGEEGHAFYASVP